MAPRRNPQFGSSGWYQNYSSDLLKGYVAQALGTAATAGQSTGNISSSTSTVRKPLSWNEMQKKMQYRIENPYTSSEIAANDYLSAMYKGLTSLSYEQALANVRAQNKVLNMAVLDPSKLNARQKIRMSKAFAGLNQDPLKLYADKIFQAMGGSFAEPAGSKFGGVGLGQVDEFRYKSLGLTPPRTQYAPEESMTRYASGGNRIVTTINNPLNQQQRSRLQRLRSMAPSSLSQRQKEALARLRAKKNAPTILP